MTTATLTGLAVPAMRKRALGLLGALLVVLAIAPYALGWLAGAVVQAGVWAWSGLVVGWSDGRATIRKGWSS